MKVVIVGAGGLGSYVGAVLAQAGHEVTLVARGEHRSAIEEDGLEVRSHAGDFCVEVRCVGSALEVSEADLAFLVTKTFSLDEVAEQLSHLGTGVPISSRSSTASLPSTGWRRMAFPERCWRTESPT